MPNKKSHHNKPHRQHKDKHSSKSKSHKRQKENVVQPNSSPIQEISKVQSPLSPIQEISKEKIKIDKHACGDFAQPKNKSTKNRSKDADNIKEQVQDTSQLNESAIDGMNDFFKSEYKKINEQSIRHHSLEKNKPSLLEKSKAIFRKEKSFNDAVHNDHIIDEISKKPQENKERTNKRHNKKSKDKEQPILEKEKHHHHHHKSRKTQSPRAERQTPVVEDTATSKNQSKDKEKQKKHKHHHKHKSKHKSKDSGSPFVDKQKMSTRVQEVVFCQLPPNPFKMKNDKNASEIRDLYKRSNREKKKDQARSVSEEMKRRQDRSNEKYRHLLEHDPEKERSRKRHSTNSNEYLMKEEYVTEVNPIEPYDNHKKTQEKNPNLRENSQISPKRNNDHWPKGLSEITLGPYEQYFVFEKEMHSKHCKKHHKKKEPALRPSIEKRHELFQKEAKKLSERVPENYQITKEAPKVVEEDKIHQIVEGDIKNYFGKIQTLIDKKLEEILQVNKGRPVSAINDSKLESKKRSRSKSKDTKGRKKSVEKILEKEKRRSKSRAKEAEGKKEERRRRAKSVTKEEIVNEVLKRIKEGEQHKEKSLENQKLTDVEISANKILSTQNKGENETKHRSSKKITDKTLLDVPLITKPKIRSHPSSDRASQKQSLLDSADMLIAKKPYEHENFKHKKEIQPFQEDEEWARRLRLAQKDIRPRDSLEYIKNRINSARERDLHNPRKHRKEPFRFSVPQPESLASCRSFSEQCINEHIYPAMCSASEETIRDSNKCKITKQGIYSPKKSPKNFIGNTVSPCHNYLINSPVRRPSIKELFTKESNSFLKEIFLPPEEFRHETNVLYSRKPLKKNQDFIVQGIEPPIHDCIRPRSRKKPERVRKLECKTVSIVAIQPQLNLKEIPVVNQTQTSSKSGKSSVTEKDLVRKRMQSKRFKSYYKYSDAQDDSSDPKSIVSDSFNIVFDTSDELILKRKHGERETCQVVPGEGANKKWNKVSTPRDSHLNNILEEPSNMSITNQGHEYFVPLKGTREFYHRTLTSSHSDYCFRIDKKPAHSKISIQSGDTEDIKCIRYPKRQKGSKSEFKILPEHPGYRNPKSKSDVLLGDRQRKQVIRYVFLEDKQNRSKSPKSPFKRDSIFKSILSEKDFFPKISKEIQTVQTEKADELEEETKGPVKVKSVQQQKQFEDIYKTIDDLEGNILSSLGITKADAATSATNVGAGAGEGVTRNRSILRGASRAKVIKDNSPGSKTRKPKMVDTSTDTTFIAQKKLDQDKNAGKSKASMEDKVVTMVHTGTGNSPPITPRLQIVENSLSSRSKQKPNVHSVAVGDDDNLSIRKNPKSSLKCKIPRPQSREQSRRSLSYKKSIGLSPIRVIGEEEAVQVNFNLGPQILRPKTFKGIHATKNILEQKKTFGTETSPNRIPTTKVVKAAARETNVTSSFPVRRQKSKGPLHGEAKPGTIATRVQQHIRPFRSRNTVFPQKPLSENTGNNISQLKSPSRGLKIKEKSPSRTADSEQARAPNVNKTLMKTEQTQASIERGQENAVACQPCFHVAEPPKKPPPEHKPSTPNDINHNDPLSISVNAYNCQPTVQINLVQAESITSSSVSDAIPRNSRRSKSLVDLRSPETILGGSKSEICCCTQTITCNRANTNESSVLSTNNMEKFTNMPMFRYPATITHDISTDKYTAARLYGSTLFVTKDYKNRAISAYERRKRYDEDIRRKKKKIGSINVDETTVDAKPAAGHQTFEVRYLSMGPQQNEMDKPIININVGGVGNAEAIYKSEVKNNFSRPDEYFIQKDLLGTLNVGEQDLLFDQHLKDRRHYNLDSDSDKSPLVHNEDIDQEKIVTQIFPLENQTSANPENLAKFCKKFVYMNKNIIDLDNKGVPSSKVSKNCLLSNNSTGLKDPMYSPGIQSQNNYNKGHVGFCLDSFCDDSISTERTDRSSSNNLNLSDNVEEIYTSSVNNNTSSNSAQTGNDFKTSVELISLDTLNSLKTVALTQPLSCPAFPTGSPSFAYLYEESCSEKDDALNQNMIGNLTKPFNQTFRFNANQYNVETPFYQKNDLESSVSQSVESGYGSVKSKNCKTNSLTNFFKRPKIAALLKPPNLILKRSNLSCSGQSTDRGAHIQATYEEMTKNCQLYAKKVRQSSEIKLKVNEEPYQEFSLQVLLGKHASLILESESVSLRLAETDIGTTEKPEAEHIASEITEVKDILDDKSELVDGQQSSHIELIKTKAVAESLSQNGCRLVLSNQSLKLKSVTYLGPEFFSNNTVDTGSFMFMHKKTMELLHEDSSSSLNLSDDSTNPFLTKSENDLPAQNFFSLLAKIFEKEFEICNKLYKDKEFDGLLQQAIKEHKKERTKNRKRFGFFKRKQSRRQGFDGEIKPDKEVKLDQKASERLQTLASNTRKCFTMLADAVKVNENIDNNVKICGLLRLLERIESGDFEVLQNEDHLNLEKEIRSEIVESYKTLYDACEKEAKKHKRRLSDNELELLKSFVIRHRIGLLTQTDIVISYISRGLIHTENQLKAAVTFLTRSTSSEINIKDFEAYCLNQ